MPTTSDLKLTLTTLNNTQTTVVVTYKVTFSAFERRLVGLGVVFRQRIAIMGVDPGGDSEIEAWGTNLPVTSDDITGPETLERTFTQVVSRSLLDEDADGDDELRCRVRIAMIGFPPLETEDAFTSMQRLGG